MKIDGKLIASEIKAELKKKTKELASLNIIPHLAVILIGNDPASLVYVGRKQKLGSEIGAKVSLFRYPRKTYKSLIQLINKLNNDPKIHGIIIQRPVPVDISKEKLDLAVTPKKDVDGFHPKSLFNPPIAEAVYKILEWVYNNITIQQYNNKTIEMNNKFQNKITNFRSWLLNQRILIIGRGETAGKPVARFLEKKKIGFKVAHSKTGNLKEECLKSDIIISCVGRLNIVRRDMVTDKTILIGVGLHSENGKLATDYNEREIANKAAFYTPVPGGVGPVNVACLFLNLIKSIKYGT